MCRQPIIRRWLRYSEHTGVTDLSDEYQGEGALTVFTLRKMKWGQRYNMRFVSVCQFFVIYWLTVATGSTVWVGADKRGHGRGRERSDKSCFHSSPLSHIHPHTWREKAVPFALLSVLLKHKQVPLSGRHNGPACLLSVFAQVWVGVRAEQVSQGTKSDATSTDWCQHDSSSPQ